MQVSIIDFGIGKKYRDRSTHQHIPYRQVSVYMCFMLSKLFMEPFKKINLSVTFHYIIDGLNKTSAVLCASELTCIQTFLSMFSLHLFISYQ